MKHADCNPSRESLNLGRSTRYSMQASQSQSPVWHGTTILTVRKGGKVVIGGDVLVPEAGVMAIGSGGNYALAAARALVDSDKDAEAIVRRSLDIAADICVYTNRNVTIEMLQG